MELQRDRARKASNFGSVENNALVIDGSSEFTGYTLLEDSGEITALFLDGKPVDQLSAGDEGIIVLDKTPFYAESGGQVGDIGQLIAKGMCVSVDDTRKQGKESIVHLVKVTEGSVTLGSSISAQVDSSHREAIRLNHTATHLMHAALRAVLGDHVKQKGSLVDAEKLRFDFSHFEPVSDDQLLAIENLVNTEIRKNNAVETRVMPVDQAMEVGAMALFGEKYGDEVRVLSIGDFSVELCGGTHASRAGDIGLFKVISETGTASGVRRIEAVTGQSALGYITALEKDLQHVADVVHAGKNSISDKVIQLVDKTRKLEKQLEALKARLASSQGSDIATQAIDIDGVMVLAATLDSADVKTLRDTVDQLKNKLGAAAVILATVADNKISLIAGVTKAETARIKAGDLVNYVAQQVGGKGGGRPDMAQAGGSEPENLDEALASVALWVKQQLGNA